MLVKWNDVDEGSGTETEPVSAQLVAAITGWSVALGRALVCLTSAGALSPKSPGAQACTRLSLLFPSCSSAEGLPFP